MGKGNNKDESIWLMCRICVICVPSNIYKHGDACPTPGCSGILQRPMMHVTVESDFTAGYERIISISSQQPMKGCVLHHDCLNVKGAS